MLIRRRTRRVEIEHRTWRVESSGFPADLDPAAPPPTAPAPTAPEANAPQPYLLADIPQDGPDHDL